MNTLKEEADQRHVTAIQNILTLLKGCVEGDGVDQAIKVSGKVLSILSQQQINELILLLHKLATAKALQEVANRKPGSFS